MAELVPEERKGKVNEGGDSLPGKAGSVPTTHPDGGSRRTVEGMNKDGSLRGSIPGGMAGHRGTEKFRKDERMQGR